MDGIINIYKEKGFTSHDVVAKLRGILKQKKIGHTGTLDPDAVGVLPVCLGRATSLCDLLTDKDKEYEAVIKLGIVTDTLDSTGTILRQDMYHGNEETIRNAIGSFVGKIEQIPPMYSAVKVNGRKLYELARKGQEIERSARKVTIHSIGVLDINLESQMVSIRAAVSKGTYIRSLCDDIGRVLGCGACMDSLVRTRSGVFDIADSITLDQVSGYAGEGVLEDKIIGLEDVFRMPCMRVRPEYDSRVRNGNVIHGNMLEEYNRPVGKRAFIITGVNDVSVYLPDGTFAAIYRADTECSTDDKEYRITKMFLKGNV